MVTGEISGFKVLRREEMESKEATRREEMESNEEMGSNKEIEPNEPTGLETAAEGRLGFLLDYLHNFDSSATPTPTPAPTPSEPMLVSCYFSAKSKAYIKTLMQFNMYQIDAGGLVKLF